MKIGSSYSLKFSSDGNLLACIAQSVSLFDIRIRKRNFAIRPVSDPSHVIFSPDSRTLIVKNTSGCLVSLKVEGGSFIRTLDEGSCEGCSPQFSTCGRYIMDGSWNGNLIVRDATSGNVVWSRTFPGEMINAIHCLNKASKWVVWHGIKATTDNEPPPSEYISIWNHPLPQGNPVRIVRSGLSFISASVPSPDERTLAVIYGAPSETLAVIDLQKGETLRNVRRKSGGCGPALSWSSDGVIASVDEDCVNLYQANSFEHLGNINLPYASDVDWSPDGQYLAVGSWKEGRIYRGTDILKAS